MSELPGNIPGLSVLGSLDDRDARASTGRDVSGEGSSSASAESQDIPDDQAVPAIPALPPSEPRTNFAFSELWLSHIVPRLREPAVQSAIEDGVRLSIQQEYGPYNPIIYDPTLPPVFYANNSYWTAVLSSQIGFKSWYETLREASFREWTEANPRQYRARLLTAAKALQQQERRNAERYSPYERLDLERARRTVLALYCWTEVILEDAKLHWQAALRHFYAQSYQNPAWYALSNDHVWNLTFGLALARATAPGTAWSCLRQPNYATVVSGDSENFFDFVYWYFHDQKDPAQQYRHIAKRLDKPGPTQSKREFYASGQFFDSIAVARRLGRRVRRKLRKLERRGFYVEPLPTNVAELRRSLRLEDEEVQAVEV